MLYEVAWCCIVVLVLCYTRLLDAALWSWSYVIWGCLMLHCGLGPMLYEVAWYCIVVLVLCLTLDFSRHVCIHFTDYIRLDSWFRIRTEQKQELKTWRVNETIVEQVFIRCRSWIDVYRTCNDVAKFHKFTQQIYMFILTWSVVRCDSQRYSGNLDSMPKLHSSPRRILGRFVAKHSGWHHRHLTTTYGNDRHRISGLR